MTILGPDDDWMLVDGARVEARFIERNDDGTQLPEHVTSEGRELGADVDVWRSEK